MFMNAETSQSTAPETRAETKPPETSVSPDAILRSGNAPEVRGLLNHPKESIQEYVKRKRRERRAQRERETNSGGSQLG